MCAQRQRIVLQEVSVFIHDVRSRRFRLILRLDNDTLSQTGRLIALHLIGDVLLHALILDLTRNLRYDHGVERIPLDNRVTLLHRRTIFEEQFRTVRNVVGQQDNLRIRIHDAQLGQTAHYDEVLLTRNLIDSLNRTQLIDLQRTLIFRSQAILCSDIGSDTTDVERTQSQLRTRLTDRLCSDDTDNLTLLNHAVRSQVTTITLRTNTLL